MICVVLGRVMFLFFSFKKPMTARTKEQLQVIQEPDELLYDFFAKRLDRQIKDYGETRMEKMVKELNRLSEHISNTCVKGSHKSSFKFADKVFEYKMDEKVKECILIGKQELDFLSMLRKFQTIRWKHRAFNVTNPQYCKS